MGVDAEGNGGSNGRWAARTPPCATEEETPVGSKPCAEPTRWPSIGDCSGGNQVQQRSRLTGGGEKHRSRSALSRGFGVFRKLIFSVCPYSKFHELGEARSAKASP